MLLRFMGMASGHKAVGRAPSGQVTLAFDLGYSEPAVQDKGDEINDEDSLSGEEEEQESEDESDFEQIGEEEVDDGDVDGTGSAKVARANERTLALRKRSTMCISSLFILSHYAPLYALTPTRPPLPKVPLNEYGV
ncbi:hypothetical protein FRC08_000375 [Ceratobasidium sp. 394]|nr:hypothetical protein FRC08_000375 [Ceratobasidium sp. 394]